MSCAKTLALTMFACFAVASSVSAATERAKERPNVVLIISDDHAWTDYGFMKHPEVSTPNIDRLASEGLTYTRGYVTTAICSPSLATMLTGLHPHQHGITGNDPMGKQPRSAWLEPFFKKPLLPRLLRDAGYLTLHTGKLWQRDPSRLGFSDHMGHTGRHGGQALAIGRDTMEPIYRFIDKAKENNKPFFVWYAPFLPHTPHNPPKRLLQKYGHLKNVNQAKYFAMIEWLDETCGDLMTKLKEKGVDDNTMVLYIADNGWNSWGKASPYENGIRTPFIVRWPGKVKPRRDDSALVSNLDVMPTILNACGIDSPEALPGIDALDSQAVSRRDTLFFANYAHDMADPAHPEKSLWTRSIIQKNWKLLAWQENPPRIKPFNGGERHKNRGENLELFDLSVDPHEKKNLAPEQSDLVKELQAKLDEWWDVE